MLTKWNIDRSWIEKARKIEERLSPYFQEIDEIREYNQLKVLYALQQVRLSDAAFAGTTGYGYDDRGREQLEAAYAQVFGAEAALVRPQICAGTQALAIALFACLRPGDELLAATGAPYDTLHQVIGISGSQDSEGTLADFGIRYREVPLLPDAQFDVEAVLAAINSKTKVVMIQRSRGYTQRRALCVDEIGGFISRVKAVYPHLIFFVDNCYGEFTEKMEPTEVGADLCVGSLIKNPGGGLAPTGAYLVGRKALILRCANRLYAPGLADHVGPTLGLTRLFVQGFYMAPHVVGECLKGLNFAAEIFQREGFETSPTVGEKRSDIIQTVTFGEKEPMLRFCEAIQAAAPIDSFVTPEPWDMPGYDCQVIMAAGAFVQGSSIELSADGPVKPPYTAYMQGGLVYENIKLASLLACQRIAAERNS